MLIPIICMTVATLIYWAFWFWRNRAKFERRKVKHSHQQVHSPLQAKLRNLAGGAESANRLYENVRRKYPNASDDWCLEKAIYDLERDRI